LEGGVGQIVDFLAVQETFSKREKKWNVPTPPPPRVAEATVATKFVVSRGAFRITLQRKYLQSPSSHSLTTWQCCFESLHCANYRP